MAKKEMSIEDINEIISIQNKATKLFQEQDELYSRLFAKYGEGVHYAEHNDSEYPWIKISLTDNVAKLKRGEDCWKSTKFSPYTFETKPLKRKPKDIEEE